MRKADNKQLTKERTNEHWFIYGTSSRVQKANATDSKRPKMFVREVPRNGQFTGPPGKFKIKKKMNIRNRFPFLSVFLGKRKPISNRCRSIFLSVISRRRNHNKNVLKNIYKI